MIRVYPNGLGAVAGDRLVTDVGLYTHGPQATTPPRVRWVHYGTGDDTNDGQERRLPKKTLGSAVSVATIDDIIVLKDGHDETFTSTLDLDQSVVIVGESSPTATIPTVKLRNNVSSAPMLTIGADFVELRHIHFPESINAAASNRVKSTSRGFRMKGCQVESGDNDDEPAVLYFSSITGAELRDMTFKAVGTAASQTTPGPGVKILGDGNIVGNGIVFDGGVNGYGSDIAMTTGIGAFPLYRMMGVQLLNSAKLFLSEAADGYIIVTKYSGDAVVDTSITGPQ